MEDAKGSAVSCENGWRPDPPFGCPPSSGYTLAYFDFLFLLKT